MIKKVWDYITDRLGTTIIHPQYLIKKHSFQAVSEAKRRAKGKLIDVGCGRMPYRKEIEPMVTEYIGQDHPDASKLYRNTDIQPDILSDARSIPVKDKSFDTVLLFEVLEHLPYPQQVLKELRRIIKPKGILIISVPFMYPIHDPGYDFSRYTDTMLRYLLNQSGFKVVRLTGQGTFYDFIAVSITIYLLKRALLTKSIFRYLLLAFGISLSFFFNILSLPVNAMAQLLPPYQNYFPLNYTVIAQPNLKKKRSSDSIR